jgi:hypothetical protein
MKGARCTNSEEIKCFWRFEAMVSLKTIAGRRG